MKKLISVLVSGIALSLVAEPLVERSRPFSVNTIVGDFKILDVKSDYCHGEYGKSGKQTFLSGVKCELEFTVSTTSFYDVDYITVNGEVYHYPKFKYNVGKLGSGGAMNVVAVSKNGEKTKPFRVNIDIAKRHPVMAFPIANTSRKNIVYKSACDGLSVFDAKGFSLKGFYSDVLKGTLSMDIDNKLQMSSSFESDSAKQTLEATKEHFKIGSFGALKKHPLKVSISGSETWRWKPNKNVYDLSETRFGAKVPFDFKLWEPRFPAICPILFCRLGLEGDVSLDGLTYDWEAEKYRFKFSGSPSIYFGGGLGSDDCDCSVGVRGGGRFVINGGLPARPDIVDEMYLQAYFKAYVKYVIGEVTFWNVESDKFYLKGGGASNAKGLSLANMARSERVASTLAEGPFSRFMPAMATVSSQDVLLYHQNETSRIGANMACLWFRTGNASEDEWDVQEIVWDDGTADGVADVGIGGDGMTIAVWENGKQVLDDDISLVDALKNFEIAVAVRDPGTGDWSAKNLTNDNSYNHSPRVLVPASGNGYLVFWLSTDIENAGDEFVKPSRLMCARHVGNGDWKIKEVARSASAPLISYDVRCEQGGRFELMWAESDYDAGVQSIHYAAEKGSIGSSGFGSISTSVLGEKEIGVMPRFVDENCGSKIVWVEDGKLQTSDSVSFANPIAVDTGLMEVSPSFAAVNGAGEVALVWTEVDSKDPAHPNHAYALMYDSSEGRWGYPVRITDDVRDESQIKATIGDDKAIRMVCCATEVSTNGIGEVIVGDSSLETYYSPTKCELVVEENCIELPTKELTIDKEYEIHTTIRNKGRRGSDGGVDILVGTYESDGETALTGDDAWPYERISFAGGETVVLTNKVELRGAAVDSRYLFAEIDPEYERRNEDGLDIDYWSDSFWLNVGKPRLELSHVEAQYDNDTNCFLSAKLKNTGTLAYPEGAKVVFHRGSVDGPVVGEDVVPEIPPSMHGEYSAGITWDMSTASFTSANETIYAVLDVSDVEFDDEYDVDVGAGEAEEPPVASVDVVTPLDANGNGVWDGEELMLALPDSYAIEYSLGEGENASSNPSSYTTNDLPISLAAPTRSGYTFVGWVQGSGLIESGSTGDLLFTAVWEKDGTTPDFVIDEGVLKGVALNGAVRVTIPEGVNVIAQEAFNDAPGLFQVTIPNSVTNIGERAFNGVGEVLLANRTAPLLIAESAIVPAAAVTVMPRDGGLSFVGWMDEVDMFLGDPFGQPGGCFVRPIWTTGPANDNFAGASSVSGAMGSSVCNNVGATSESGDPLIAYELTATASVWWRWTAPQSGQFRFFTSGSGFDTVMGVYKGVVLSTLEVVAENDDAENMADGSSSVLFEAESGVTYYISVAGKDGVTGSIMLNWEPLSDYAWQYEQTDDGLEITGVVPEPEGVLSIPDNIGGRPVVEIRYGAFENCLDVTGVVIPGSVKVIGSYAFRGCNALETVELSNGVASIESCAFENCTSLSKVVLPNSVTNIGSSAFWGCEALASIALPDSVMTIGGSAFQDCSNDLYDMATIPGVKLVDGWAVGYVVGELPNVLQLEGIRGVGDWAFYQCSDLTSVEIGNGVKNLGERAFYNCREITEVAIAKDVKNIGKEAFRSCAKLTSFFIAEGNEWYASINGLLCDKQGTVVVCCPGGVSSVEIPSTVITIGDCSFCECNKLRQVSIPNSVICIGDSAFDDCEALETITLGKNVEVIGELAFYNCEALSDIVVPDSVKIIERGAFEWCRGLKSAVIGRGVSYIGDSAFWGCESLRRIIFRGNSPSLEMSYVLYMGEYISTTFYKVADDCIVYVPRGFSGWGVEIPGVWNGMRIEYADLSTPGWIDVETNLVGAAKGAVTSKTDAKTGVTTLTAKVGNKNSLFAYWIGPDGEKAGFGATLKVNAATQGGTYTAVFTTKAGCVAPSLDKANAFAKGGATMFNSVVGVAASDRFVVPDECYPVKFAVKGMPNGLKVNATSGDITGVPTKAGKFTATVTVTSVANSKKKVTVKVPITIAKLPKWTYGTFTGIVTPEGAMDLFEYPYNYSANPDTDFQIGSATMTVGATGKISLKVAQCGTNWMASASGFAATSVCESGRYNIKLTAKATIGKKTYSRPFSVVLQRYSDYNDVNGGPTAAIDSTIFDGVDGWYGEIHLQRYFWNDSAADTAMLASYAGAYTYYTEDNEKLTLTVAANGTVKVVGTLANGRKLSLSTRVVLAAGGEPHVFVYAPPATAKVKSGKTTKTVKYDEFFCPVFIEDNYNSPGPGGGIAYRNAGVRPYAEGSGTGTFAYSPAYGQATSNKIVTVTAKPSKNSVFAYWMYDGDIVSYSTSYKMTMLGFDDTSLTAVFRLKSDFADVDVEPWWENANGDEIEKDDVAEIMKWKLFTGLKTTLKFCVPDEIRPVKFTATGLPKGMSLNATTGVLSGIPTAASSGTAKITVTCTGNTTKKATQSFKFTTRKLRKFAQGTFKGTVNIDCNEMTQYWDGSLEEYVEAWNITNTISKTWTVTVGANGKASGKITENGKTYVLSTACYSSYEDESTYTEEGDVASDTGKALAKGLKTYEDETFTADGTISCGGNKWPVTLVVRETGDMNPVATAATRATDVNPKGYGAWTLDTLMTIFSEGEGDMRKMSFSSEIPRVK